MTDTTALPTRGISPVGRLSYPHLFTAQAAEEGGKPKFSLAIIWDKATQATEEFKTMKRLLLNAGRAKYGPDLEAMILDGRLRFPLRKDLDKKYGDGSDVFANFRSDTPPGLVAREADPATGKPARITAEEQVPGHAHELYPGCQVRCSFSAYAYDRKGNKGIGAGLNNVQKMGEGARIDNRKSAHEEFEADLTAAPASLEDLI